MFSTFRNTLYVYIINNRGCNPTKHKIIITKKEISESTKATRGTGFNPNWKYTAKIDGVWFEKYFTDGIAYAELPTRAIPIGEVTNKKEFVDRVYDYINSSKTKMSNEEIRAQYQDGELEFSKDRAISEGMEQMASEMGTNVDNQRFLGDFWYSFDPAEYGFE